MPSENPGAASVFITDPDADDRTLIGLLMRKAGWPHPLHAHATGEELLATLTQLFKRSLGTLLPAVCFLELGLPAMSGDEVIRRIRSEAAFDRVSLVVVSSRDHPAEVRKAAQAGAQCYLAKYPQPAVLRQVLHEARRCGESSAADEWFGLPANLQLRWFSPRRALRSSGPG